MRRGGGEGGLHNVRKRKGNSGFRSLHINIPLTSAGLHNGMAARLCIQCLEFEMKLLREVAVEVEREMEVLVVK